MASAEKIKKTKSKAEKIASGIITGISILFLVIAIFFLIVTLVARGNGRRAVSIFGYSFSIVQTDSMTGEIEVGELITVKICGIERAEVGMNAVYIASSGQLKGQQIVHKVIQTDVDEKGAYIVTQGIKEGASVDAPVHSEQFVGIAVSHSRFWGSVMRFFGTPVNWLLILVILVGIPGIYMLVKLIIRYSKEAKEEKNNTDETSGDRKQ